MGVAITGLQTAGTSIPGNDGYPVDGLIRTETPQLSLAWIRLRARRRDVCQPLLRRSFRAARRLYAFFSDPANRKTSEPLVKFTATKARLAPNGRAAESGRFDHDSRLYERALMIARPLHPTPTTLKPGQRACAACLSALGFGEGIHVSDNLHRRRSGHDRPADQGEARGRSPA